MKAVIPIPATTKIHSFRQTNGTDYGAGKVEILTNTGGIKLESLGDNTPAGPTGVNGGAIEVIGHDSDILLKTDQDQLATNRQIKLEFTGGHSGQDGFTQPDTSSIAIISRGGDPRSSL